MDNKEKVIIVYDKTAEKFENKILKIFEKKKKKNMSKMG